MVVFLQSSTPLTLSRIRTYLNSWRIAENFEREWANKYCADQCICTFSLFVIVRWIYSWHFQICQISENIGKYVCLKNQFSALLVSLCENVREYYRRILGIHLFSAILRELTYVRIQLYIIHFLWFVHAHYFSGAC